MGLSLIASYPLMFSGLRESLITLAKTFFPAHNESFDLVWLQDAMSVMLVGVITLCAVMMEDAGLVVGLVGAICGSAIIYIIPGVLFVRCLQSGLVSEDKNAVAYWFTHFLIGLGCFLMVAGTIMTVM